jgi:predicted ATP-grasp superfamily ATP-dependent carboligase
MQFDGIRVLVLDGDGKQTLAMIRGLKEIGCRVTVLCGSKLDVCWASKMPDKKLLMPEADWESDEFIPILLKLVSTGEYDVLMPIGELTTNPVTQHEAEFQKYVKLACAPRETYIKAFDKQTTFDTAMENGIPCPYTRHSQQDIEDFLARCRFPIIIKPRQGLGSIGFHKFETEAEFRERLKDPAFNVDEYVVQEFVKFDNRIGTNLFMDREGNVCSAYAVDVLRWFPVDAGAGVLIVTVDAHEVLAFAGELLKALKWQGFANVAFMVDRETGEPRLLEINGRIPASIKMAYMCGFNISRQFMEMIYDQPVTRYPENDKFGMYIRHLDTDMAWFLKSPDRFRTKPSWFSWKNTKEILYSRDDRKPFFAHFLQQLTQYRKIMKRKRH